MLRGKKTGISADHGYHRQGLAAVAAGTAVVANLLTGVAVGNVTGSGFQTFNPVSGNGPFVTVHGAETLATGSFSLGLFLNHAVNTLPYFERDGFKSEADRDSFRDSLLSADLIMGYGLIDDLELGISLPSVLNQNVEAEGPRGQFAERGITEAKIGAKYRLFTSGKTGIAVAGSVNLNLTDDNPYAGSEGGPVYNGELIGETGFGDLTLAGNVGYRWTNAGQGAETLPIKPFGNQFIASVGTSYRIKSLSSSLIGEIYGSGAPRQGFFQDSSRDASSAEALLGWRIDQNDNLNWNFGAGTELSHGNSTADYRLYAGVRWVSNQKPRSVPPPITPAPKPAAAIPQMPAPEKVVVISDVLFQFDSDRLVESGARTSLDNLMAKIKRGEALERLVIEGHTCSLGSDRYNQSLSQRRASAIRDMLVKRYGVPADKILAVGHGETRPVAANSDNDGRRRNRRVEFKIYRVTH